MAIEKDGGPAFPSDDIGYDGRGDEFKIHHNGMSLRDWFAGQALCSIPVRNWQHVGSDDEIIRQWAQTAYAVADAMLAARKEG